MKKILIGKVLKTAFRNLVDNALFLLISLNVASAASSIGVLIVGATLIVLSVLGVSALAVILPPLVKSLLYYLIIGLIGIVTFIFLQGIGLGYMKIMLNIHDKKLAYLKQLFSVFNKAIPYAIATLIYYFIVGGGLILLIIPGIYWMARFIFFPQIMVDKKVCALESLRASWRLTQGNASRIILLIFIVYSFGIIGYILKYPFKELTTGPWFILLQSLYILFSFILVTFGVLANIAAYRQLASIDELENQESIS